MLQRHSAINSMRGTISARDSEHFFSWTSIYHRFIFLFLFEGKTFPGFFFLLLFFFFSSENIGVLG